jgi:hypothetical protein
MIGSVSVFVGFISLNIFLAGSSSKLKILKTC